MEVTVETFAPWIGFNLFVLAMLALDLGVFHRKAHAISVKEAALWSVIWIGLALLFTTGVYVMRGSVTALEFFTGYLIEKSLSIDNIFVFVLIFSALQVPATSQHRVLFWGILGALLMRGILILVGSVLLEEFHWILYLFGLFLIFTGIRMAFQGDEEQHPENNRLVKWLSTRIPLTPRYEGDRLLTRKAGKWLATPLLLVLLVVETSDLLFAVDSIPAVFAVTHDPFIVYTSNVFAILGLRSLYFVLAGVVSRLYYLKLGLAGILSFVGVKMVVADLYEIPIMISLLGIAAILAIAVVASVLRERRGPARPRIELEE
jgi:tellurite resistance protein TerC